MIGKVFFDGKDTYTEYGLLLASKSISLPESAVSWPKVWAKALAMNSRL